MLDILLFRADKGGDPEKVRESQRKRGASVEVVDEIIALDKEWIASTPDLLLMPLPHACALLMPLPRAHALLTACRCPSNALLPPCSPFFERPAHPLRTPRSPSSKALLTVFERPAHPSWNPLLTLLRSPFSRPARRALPGRPAEPQPEQQPEGHWHQDEE